MQDSIKRIDREKVIARAQEAIEILGKVDEPTFWLDFVTNALYDAIALVKAQEPVIDAVWVFYINDEGKARWRCSNCGKIVRRDPHDKPRCSLCGAHMRKEA